MSSTGRLTLIQQNDVHAQLETHWEHFWRGGRPEYRRVGGLARAATVANAIKRETGAALLVDCGDAIHGTLPAMRTQGQVVVPVLNAMGVDLMTPGNWEYGFGPAALQARAAEMSFTTIACNLQDAASGERLFPPFVVRELGGVRVGFVGLTSPIVPRMSPRFAAGLRFPDPSQTLVRCVSRLRQQEGAALVVVVSHLGFAQDVALARAVDGLDVILSGHTHNRLERPARVGKTLIIQSGFSGSFLGRLDLEVERGVVVAHRHELIELREEIEPDTDVQRIVDEALAPFRGEMSEVVGRTDTGLHRMGLLETSMDNLITAAYRELTGAQVALSHGWRFGPPVPPGPITLGDLWAMVPTDPDVFTIELSGQQLLLLLEENMHGVLADDALDQAGGYLLRTAGMSVVFRPNNGRGTRVERLQIGDDPVELERVYTVASAGGQAVGEPERRRGTGVSAIEAVRRYLEAHDQVSPAVTHTSFIAQ